MVCGNTHMWKGAETVSLTTVATARIMAEVLEANGLPGGIGGLVQGAGSVVGQRMAEDKRVELLSFTGSTEVGRRVNTTIAGRFG